MSEHVLIVGAGSMGVYLGYNLQLSGAKVTFLVRPHRVQSLEKPQVLYSYKTHSIATFKEYGIISDLKDIAKSTYDYVIITLDGHSAVSPDGITTLKAIGDAVRNHSTVILNGTVSIDARAHVAKIAELPEERILDAILWVLVHEVKRANLPIHPPTDAELIGAADYAFSESQGGNYYLLSKETTETIDRFQKLFAKAGKVKADLIDPQALGFLAYPLFAVFLGWALEGWVPTKDLGQNSEVWELTTNAVKEIQLLFSSGEVGKAASVTTPESLQASFVQMESLAFPLDYAGFTKYHHGGKVKAQDDEIIEFLIAELEKEGKPNVALKELYSRAKQLA